MKKLRFKVKVTPAQSEQLQKQIFDKGGTWSLGETEVINTDWPYLALIGKNLYGAARHEASSFEAINAPEVLFHTAIGLVVLAKQVPSSERRLRSTGFVHL